MAFNILDPIISLKDVSTMIEGRFIHKDINLSIPAQKICAIIGSSGSGKTTLLRHMLGLQYPVAGEIYFLGKEIRKYTAEEEKKLYTKIGVLFQKGALFSSLTVLENIMFPLKKYTALSLDSCKKIAYIKLEMVGLCASVAFQYPAELSGGMQKRVGLARALALDPCILFLDEPTAGLDPKSAEGFDILVYKLTKYMDLTVVIVTHDMDTLWAITDSVAFLAQGKILAVSDITTLAHMSDPAIQEYFTGYRAQPRPKFNDFVV